MAKLRQFVTMPIKQQTLIKYFFIIFFIIHWTACTLRLLTSFAVGDCRPKVVICTAAYPSTTNARERISTRTDGGARAPGPSPWPDHLVHRPMSATIAVTFPPDMEETVLNTLVMLMGIVVMAFLVGENILGNFDPVFLNLNRPSTTSTCARGVLKKLEVSRR